MAAPGDITVVKDGGHENAGIHPYLVTLVRWCISCVWSTATVFLHRLLTAPLLPITAAKVPPKPAAKPRPAGKEHLHPEPLVDCVVLHQPEAPPTLDVIFVHGLYGSLGNTWRQGDWRSKYKLDPTKITLRDNPSATCNCCNSKHNEHTEFYSYESEINDNTFNNECEMNDVINNDNENISFNDINERLLKKIIPNENSLITEQFYNNTLVNQTEIVDNYDTQARFVEELFRNENKNCGTGCDSKSEFNDKSVSNDNDFKLELNECKCGNECQVGCGCVCDDCYSSCWPRDWIKEDFPGARVISINYTSDPYLWRPLWVKQCQRLRLHERAEQMMDQLLGLGVGQRPIIWVGHSKGGLFIKQIYCEAYDAYSKITDKNVDMRVREQNCKDYNVNNISNLEYYSTNEINHNEYTMKYVNEKINNTDAKNDIIHNEHRLNREINMDSNIFDHKTSPNLDNKDNDKIHNNFNDSANIKYILHTISNDSVNIDSSLNRVNNDSERNDDVIHEVSNDTLRRTSVSNDDQMFGESVINVSNDVMNSSNSELNDRIKSSVCKEDIRSLNSRSSLWSSSAGFMFYSVPHRGSPLADIKTPITTRSIELLEIAKDCPLVLGLQARWLAAAGPGRPAVRSLVETGRTLMSMVWLRIVSADSADAGVGPLHGVSVDHREICKPASRSCPLYRELKHVIHNALHKCRCQ